MAPEAFWANVTFIPDTGCWVWLGSTQINPYGSSSVDGVPFVGQPHRAAFFLTHGYAPGPGRVVAHKCDVPGCINPDHLEDITHRQNLADARERLRQFRGRATPLGRMWIGVSPCATAVRLAVYMARKGLNRRDMANLLGVSASSVHQVLTGKRRPGLGFAVVLGEITDGEITLIDWVESDPKSHARRLKQAAQ